MSRIKKARQPYRRGTTSQQDRQRGGRGENRSRPAHYPSTYRALTAAKLRVGGIAERVGKPRRNLRQEQTPLSTKQAETPLKRGVGQKRQDSRRRYYRAYPPKQENPAACTPHRRLDTGGRHAPRF